MAQLPGYLGQDEAPVEWTHVEAEAPAPPHPPELASTEIPEANITKVKLECIVTVSFIFLFLFTLLI